MRPMAIDTEPNCVDDKVKRVAERVLRESLAPYGFARADIRSYRDHDGDPALIIDVYYDFLDQAIEPKVTFGLVGILRSALDEVGETRFPYVRHHFDERQKIAS
jgi:hypothetical protein